MAGRPSSSLRIAQSERDLRAATAAMWASSFKAACTTRRSGRWNMLGLADEYGKSTVADLCPERDLSADREEVSAFCLGKKAVLIVEEGAARVSSSSDSTRSCAARDIQTRMVGKDVLPSAGEYTGAGADRSGMRKVPEELSPATARQRAAACRDPSPVLPTRGEGAREVVPPRPPGFCTGCPERPIFTAMKMVERELGDIMSRPTSAATCSRSCRRSTSAKPPWVMASAPARRPPSTCPADKRVDRGDGRWRFLAQWPDVRSSAMPCSTSTTA